MQKFILVLLIAFTAILSSCKKQSLPPAHLGFEKQIIDSADDYCNAMISVNDKFLYLAGYTIGNSGDKNFMLMKMDLDGNLIWKKEYGIALLPDECFSIKLINDNQLLLAGMSTVILSGDENMMLVKTDLDGNLIWQKGFGTPANDVAADVLELQNKNLFIAGNSRDFNSGTRSVYWVITDADGNVLHQNHIGTSLEDGGSKVILDKNNLPVILAWTDSGQIGARDFG